MFTIDTVCTGESKCIFEMNFPQGNILIKISWQVDAASHMECGIPRSDGGICVV